MHDHIELVLLIWIKLIPAGINNYMHHDNVWYEFTKPFPNFDGTTTEVW